MNEDFIERYDTFNIKGFPEDLIFGDFTNQPIPSTYSDLKNSYDDDVTPIYSALTDNEVVEYPVVINDKNNDDNSLASDIDPPPYYILETEVVERMGNETHERKFNGLDCP